MFKLRVSIYSPSYKIYREKLNRWECPPTRASLYSFVSVLFKHFLSRFYRAFALTLLVACAMCCSVWTCIMTLAELDMSASLLFDVIVLFTIIFMPLSVAIFIILQRIKRWRRLVVSGRQYVKISYRLVRFGEKLKGLLNPTIKFTGHPPSKSEIERF